KLLLPILGDQYGAELEAGHIQLTFDETGFNAGYGDTRLPLDPQTLPLIFEPQSLETPDDHLLDSFGHLDPEVPELYRLLSGLQALPPHATCDPKLILERRREAPQLTQALQGRASSSPRVREFIAQAVAESNGRVGEPRSFDRLHHLLEAQVYRLANWRV